MIMSEHHSHNISAKIYQRGLKQSLYIGDGLLALACNSLATIGLVDNIMVEYNNEKAR